MVKTFSANEQKIAKLFSLGTTFKFHDEQLTVTKVAKPVVSSGECKTDIYIEAVTNTGCLREIKISYKQENAQFIENKMQADRAQILLGTNWRSIIESGIKNLKSEFETRPIIIKSGGRKGSITLGWKYELLDVKSGHLSTKLSLSIEQVKDIYTGEKLPEDKRNATVNGELIKNSGVANYMLRTNNLSTIQSVIDNLQTIDEYIKEHPDVYFACKALNYRTFDKKYDGNRPLAVQIDWINNEGMLAPVFHYSTPLERKGSELAEKLLNTLDSLGIANTDDIDEYNFSRPDLIK